MFFITFIKSIIFLVINILLFQNATRLCCKYYAKDHSKIDSIIVILTLYISQIVLFTTLLGILTILTYYYLIICFIILYLIIYFFTKDNNYKFNIFEDFKKIINFFKNNQILLMLVILCCSILLLQLKRAFLELPVDNDSLNHHIPIAVEWLKKKNLYVFDNDYWFYPGNNELLTLWYLMPFRNDVIIGLQSWLPFLICLFSIFSIGKKFKINKFEFTNAYSWFDKEIKNKNVKIKGLTAIYPFYGPNLENNIIYDEIQLEKIDYYIIGSEIEKLGSFASIDEELKHSNVFRLVYCDNMIHIYKNIQK